ncbi:MAG: TonB-dependent receptor [Pseudohongiella sp.]|nr:TonB-dependent receptor [Pseudohongiella sp.]
MKSTYLLSAAIAVALPTHAQTNSDADNVSGDMSGQITRQSVREILILGTDFDLQGDPETATEGVVYAQQLELRPVSRTAELLEFVPGMIATQHSGEGKANQYFVRGFNLDHGTDFAISVDKMPVNTPSHGHGQGYADINFIIPELVGTLRYRKGPYYADAGNFATAGSAEFVYLDSLDEGQISLTLGEHGYRRLFAGESFAVGDGKLTLAGALTDYDGPWDLNQDLDKRNAMIKYHEQGEDYSLSITGLAYDNSWDATDQIPLRAVENGTLSIWGNIDPTAGGESRRNSLSMDYDSQLDNQNRWQFSAYLMDYELDLYSNFTYFDADPVRGDQFQQTDGRRVAGIDTQYERDLATSLPTTVRFGLQHRYDDIHVGLHLTEQRQRYESTRDDYVEQSLTSAYAAVDTRWTSKLRTVASLRTDHYRFRVDDLLGSNSGNGNDSLLNPRLNVIYTLTDDFETYLSAGQGYHSNDARGATTRTDPMTGDPTTPVDPLATARSYEVGLKSTIIPRTQITLTAFRLKLSSELIYVGDAGNTEALSPSERDGVEVDILYSPLDWLLIDADATWTDASLKNVGPDDYIPNAVRNTASLGVIADNIRDSGWSAGLRMRYLGSAPLIEDNSVRTDPTTLVNAQLSTRLTDSISLDIELLNVLDSRDSDITYYYASRLPNEAQAVEDIHFHPAEPRSLRATITARF